MHRINHRTWMKNWCNPTGCSPTFSGIERIVGNWDTSVVFRPSAHLIRKCSKLGFCRIQTWWILGNIQFGGSLTSDIHLELNKSSTSVQCIKIAFWSRALPSFLPSSIRDRQSIPGLPYLPRFSHNLQPGGPARRCIRQTNPRLTVSVWGKNVDPSAGLLGKPAKTFMVCKFALQRLRHDLDVFFCETGFCWWRSLGKASTSLSHWAVPPSTIMYASRAFKSSKGPVSRAWDSFCNLSGSDARCDEDPGLRTQHGLP